MNINLKYEFTGRLVLIEDYNLNYSFRRLYMNNYGKFAIKVKKRFKRISVNTLHNGTIVGWF